VIHNSIKNFINWNGSICSSYEFSMIYTNSSTYFYIKNLFSIYFLWFSSFLDWASISGKHRGSGTNDPKTQTTHAVDCGLVL
jgi:hypothetical protein